MKLKQSYNGEKQSYDNGILISEQPFWTLYAKLPNFCFFSCEIIIQLLICAGGSWTANIWCSV